MLTVFAVSVRLVPDLAVGINVVFVILAAQELPAQIIFVLIILHFHGDKFIFTEKNILLLSSSRV